MGVLCSHCHQVLAHHLGFVLWCCWSFYFYYFKFYKWYSASFILKLWLPIMFQNWNWKYKGILCSIIIEKVPSRCTNVSYAILHKESCYLSFILIKNFYTITSVRLILCLWLLAISIYKGLENHAQSFLYFNSGSIFTLAFLKEI